MSKFKVGDKVRCVEANQGQWIEVGEIYTVKKCKYWEYVQLEEIAERHNYYESRFELVSEKPNYREMSPDSTVKVKIGDYEFDCPIKELLIVDAISGNIVGQPRTSVFFDNIIQTQ